MVRLTIPFDKQPGRRFLYSDENCYSFSANKQTNKTKTKQLHLSSGILYQITFLGHQSLASSLLPWWRYIKCPLNFYLSKRAQISYSQYVQGEQFQFTVLIRLLELRHNWLLAFWKQLQLMDDKLFEPRTYVRYQCIVSKKSGTFNEVFDLFVGFVNFLDVCLNLSDGTHMPFNIPDNIPLYINKQSKHPPRIIGNIQQSINRRLSKTSYGKESLEKAAPIYQKALGNDGYKHLLTLSSHIS